MSKASTLAHDAISAKVDTRGARAMLKRIKTRAPEETRMAMGKAAAYWHAQALPSIPVSAKRGRGQLRQRTQPFAEKSGRTVRGGLKIMTHYAIWLVAGTRAIAGGRVMRWKEGQKPIDKWDAKDAGGGPRGELPVALPSRLKAVKFFVQLMKKGVTK